MVLIEWIVDFIEFFREIIFLFFVVAFWNIFTGRMRVRDILGIFIPRLRQNRTQRPANGRSYTYYDDDESYSSHQSHLSDEPLYTHQYDDDEGRREYDSPGDFIMNGSPDEFDYTNENHVAAYESYDDYK